MRIFRLSLLTYSLLQTAANIDAQYSLQILHASDLEGGVEAIEKAPNFAAIIDKLQDEHPNSITLSAGDNYIPGPFFSAALDISLQQVIRDVYDVYYGGINVNDLRTDNGRIDISIMNLIGFDASALGNHEFDAGTDAIATIIGEQWNGGFTTVRWVGSQFPYLSCNLNFANDPNLSGYFTGDIEDVSFFKSNPNTMVAGQKRSLAPSASIERGGELIGVVGVTTPLLASISSPGNTQVTGPSSNDMPGIAALVQPVIDQLTMVGVNKIIVLSHLQDIILEQQLALLLDGVDVIVAGGSDSILANEGDELWPGQENLIYANYPLVTNDLSNNPCLIVSTEGQYDYVGRLIVEFDPQGVILLDSIDQLSGPYICSESKVTELWGSYAAAFVSESTAELVTRLTDAVLAVVTVKDGNIFGRANVYLDGRRSQVRTQETNLGNLTADANLAVAQDFDSDVVVSVKNGGGIRAAIGEVVEVSETEYEFGPNSSNPLSGKSQTEISQLDIENSLRFNNKLSVLTLTALDFASMVEHGLGAWTPTATPGAFPQFSGIKVAFDPALTPGDRVISLGVFDDDGEVTDTIIYQGVLQGDPTRPIRLVTLDFLANGGDGYPFASGFDRVDLDGILTDSGNAFFASNGSEQDAFAEFLFDKHRINPYCEAERPSSSDERIQNLSFRADEVFLPLATASFVNDAQYTDETSGAVSVPLTVVNPRDVAVTISIDVSEGSSAVEGEDYTTQAQFEFQPGTSTQNIVVNLIDDTEPFNGVFIGLIIKAENGFRVGTKKESIVLINDNDRPTIESAGSAISLTHLGSIGWPEEDNVSEIVSFDPVSKKAFVSNSAANSVGVYDFSNPVAPVFLASWPMEVYGGGINSVAFKSGLLAIALEGATVQDKGSVLFMNSYGNVLNQVQVGALPDMLAFAPDGNTLLVANEGEPNADYSIDPEGSVSFIPLQNGVAQLTNDDVIDMGFQAFNSQTELLISQGLRVFGPGATLSQDMEPEYITFNAAGDKAWVACQENNALAVVDLAYKVIVDIMPLGTIDHSAGTGILDASDRPGTAFLNHWPIKGFFMPDAIASYEVNGVPFIITANEGDAREYDAFAEVTRLGSSGVILDADAYPDGALLKNNHLLGRLNITTAQGDEDGDGDLDQIHSFGTRSFSIFNGLNGELIFDSGSEFERITLANPQFGSLFNASNANNTYRNRSDDKGPEAEGVALGEIEGRTYAFIGLERVGGVMVYDITNPAEAEFMQYINTRNVGSFGGDLGPEGLLFVPKSESPNGRDLLLVTNEISGTLGVFQVNKDNTQLGYPVLESFELFESPGLGEVNGNMLHEGGISGMHFLPDTENQYLLVTDRGPNAIADLNANNPGGAAKYFPFPDYSPKIMHVELVNDSIHILSVEPLLRNDLSPATGLPNPIGAGGTGETAWSDLSGTIIQPDPFGIDSEGIAIDNDGSVWLCEEYGASLWQLNPENFSLQTRYTPFPTSALDSAINAVNGKRVPNRGFEGVAYTPEGLVYAALQSPAQNPDVASGNASRVHRIAAVNPETGEDYFFIYVNDGTVGQIRTRDWKLGDLVAINNTEFLTIEHAERLGWNEKNIYKFSIEGATAVTEDVYNGLTPEQLSEPEALMAAGIVPVQKTKVLDLLESGWDLTHDKPEGLTIVDDYTIALVNDNDYGIDAPAMDGVITVTGKTTVIYVYQLGQPLGYIAPYCVVDLPDTVEACGEALLVAVSDIEPETYMWSDQSTGEELNATISGVYALHIETAQGCVAQDSTMVTINPIPMVDLGEDISLCAGESATLTSGASGDFQWSSGSAELAIVVAETGLFTLTVTGAEGCVAQDEVEVIIFDLPVPQLEDAAQLCPGESITLNPGKGFADYQWSTGQTASNIQVSDPGFYSVSVTNEQGCLGTDEVLIEILTTPLLDLGEPIGACVGEPVTLDAGLFASYLWNTGAEIQTITVSETGVYSIEVTNDEGCIAESSVIVFFNECIGIGEMDPTLGIALYPNPANEFVIVNAGAFKGIGELHFYSVQGKLIYNKSVAFNGTPEQVFISNLASGAYQVALLTESFFKVLRFVVVD